VPLGHVEPMLPTLAAEAPAGDAWQHEIKYDGYRTQLVVERPMIRAFSRRGFDWTPRYPGIVAGARCLDCRDAVIDDEAIVQDASGRSDFAAFQEAIGRNPESVVFMAFDLMHLNGEDLRERPLWFRRNVLRELVGAFDAQSRIQFSDNVVGDGQAMFRLADQMGLEGIVSKRINSGYRSGRTRAWLKVKCWEEGEFVVTALNGRRAKCRLPWWPGPERRGSSRQALRP